MKLIINSLLTLDRAKKELEQLFNSKKYLSIKIDFSKRSILQNSLQFAIYADLQRQGDQTAAEYRNYCKYHFGLAIRAESDSDFARFMRETLTRYIYEERLKIMDFVDVTSTFNREQMTRYINQIYQEFEPKGFHLTKPE